MRKRSRYSSYRGRAGTADVLKVIAVLLVILFVLSLGAFFLLQRHMVYSDDGSVRLDLPFFREDHPGEEATLPPLETPEPEVEIVAPAGPERIVPVSLSRTALYDGTAAELVTEGGGTAAMVDMKGDTGELGWVSDLPLAIAAKVSEDDPSINIALRTAADDGVYRIARISCFKDDLLSDADTSMAILTNSGYRWTDPEQVHWVSPTSEKVQDYLAALCVELSTLGFDEILLEHAGYPTEGNLHYIKKGEAYNADEFSQVISAFYARVASALEGTDTLFSVVYDPETTALSGQSEAGITAAGARIVTKDSGGNYYWPED